MSNTKVYMKQGGDELVVSAGGTLTIEAGATVAGLAAVVEQTALADLTENGGAIGGTNDGNMPAITLGWNGTAAATAAEGAAIIAAIRELAAKQNALLAKLRAANIIAD